MFMISFFQWKKKHTNFSKYLPKKATPYMYGSVLSMLLLGIAFCKLSANNSLCKKRRHQNDEWSVMSEDAYSESYETSTFVKSSILDVCSGFPSSIIKCWKFIVKTPRQSVLFVPVYYCFQLVLQMKQKVLGLQAFALLTLFAYLKLLIFSFIHCMFFYYLLQLHISSGQVEYSLVVLL